MFSFLFQPSLGARARERKGEEEKVRGKERIPRRSFLVPQVNLSRAREERSAEEGRREKRRSVNVPARPEGEGVFVRPRGMER